jgi:daunorubicin resistance ABC transporter ATP-binding subunit
LVGCSERLSARLADMGAVLEARGLRKRFKDVQAVDHVDLIVQPGERVGLLGPNGAGKTTTVRILSTLVRADAGHARVAGFDVVADRHRVRRRISLTGQYAAVDELQTGAENLHMVGRLSGLSGAQARVRAQELLERFDLTEAMRRRVATYSGGMRRRLDLAASLVGRPSVIFLDEPTTGLDPRSRQVVWSTIRELVADGVTLLLTTQYLEEADALADRVVLIDHGREIAAGTPAQLKAQVGQQRIDVVAVDNAAFARLTAALDEQFTIATLGEQRTISIPAPHEVADLARVSAAVADTGIPVDEVALRRPTLDDAFIALTGKPPAKTSEPVDDNERQEVAA